MIVTTICFITCLVSRYNDWLLPLFMQFLLILLRISKHVRLRMSRPILSVFRLLRSYNLVAQVSFMRAATSHVTHMPATWTQLVEETQVLVGLWAPTITVWTVTEVAECPRAWILTWDRGLSSYKVILPIHPCLASPASKCLSDLLPVCSWIHQHVWFVHGLLYGHSVCPLVTHAVE